jgi:tRNA (guanine37-N1)-methyltransferase
MRIDIITILPDLIRSPFENSILKRAIQSGIVQVNIINLRDYANNKHKSVDDKSYGGEAGMVMMIEPIANCINSLKGKTSYDEIIYLTPDGDRFDQRTANSLSTQKNLILLCGHYKGIDERIREHFITKEISIGDYVLTGGELAAAVICDSVIRLIPGVLNDETSALFDSFQDNLLSPPVYTRPETYNGWSVPEILLSGNKQKIKDWLHEMSMEKTLSKRPDLLK